MLEENSEIIQIGDVKLIVFVKGRKPQCFKCSKIGHVRAECKPPRKETEEEGGDEKEKKKSLKKQIETTKRKTGAM